MILDNVVITNCMRQGPAVSRSTDAKQKQIHKLLSLYQNVFLIDLVLIKVKYNI